MTNVNEKKPEDIAALCATVRDRMAQHPELFAMTHRNGRPLSRPYLNTPVQSLGIATLLRSHRARGITDYPVKLDANCPIIIDYSEPLDVHALQLVSREDAEATVMTVLKARKAAGNHFTFDSLGAITDLDRARLSGDPLTLPDIEDPTPVKKGFKLKPNATGMFRQFVDRNHRR